LTFIVRSEIDTNIWVQVIRDSITKDGDRIFTIHAHYPRIIHAEVKTHRVLSTNSSSSRAVPVLNFIETIEDNPFIPSFLGTNKPGMVAGEDLSEEDKKKAIKIWKSACKSALRYAKQLQELQVHKQIANRLTEPFQYMNTVITATEFENFLWLRDHPEAEPHFHELASLIKIALQDSTPQVLNVGEWHLPFIDTNRDENGILHYGLVEEIEENPKGTFTPKFTEIDLQTAQRISASCVAQISYRKCDRSIEKANDIFKRLIESDPMHSSPVEHQATPIDYGVFSDVNLGFNDSGITHMDRLYRLCSGNLKHWIQYRQLLQNIK
jgi:hypothetical protein